MAIVRISSSKIDKLRELMRKVLVFIAMGLLSLLTVNNSSYAEQSASQFSLLDMSQFSSAVEAKDAFDAVYRKGSNVCPVIKYLEANANRSSSPFELYDFTLWGWVQETAHKYNPFVKDDGFFVQVPRPDENMDVWRINILHSGCRLREAKFRLQYKDKNFAKRGIPFRFEYFEDTALVGNVAAHHALISLIMNGTDTLSKIEDLMHKSDMTITVYAESNNKKKNLGGGLYGFSYKIFYYSPHRTLGKCSPWNIGIQTDDAGAILWREGHPKAVVTPPYCHSL